MQLYGLKTCDTCRKALKELTEVTLVDVRAEGVPEEVLDRALRQFDRKIVNTRSTTWRSLSEVERGRDPKELLLAHPTLMKRPLIEDDGELYLGWSAEIRAALVSE